VAAGTQELAMAATAVGRVVHRAGNRQDVGGGGSYDINGSSNVVTKYATWNTTIFGAVPVLACKILTRKTHQLKVGT
jgi:hypothetical protein